MDLKTYQLFCMMAAAQVAAETPPRDYNAEADEMEDLARAFAHRPPGTRLETWHAHMDDYNRVFDRPHPGIAAAEDEILRDLPGDKELERHCRWLEARIRRVL